jgi:hypothetical protein
MKASGSRAGKEIAGPFFPKIESDGDASEDSGHTDGKI